jgi:hypothetical protein
LINILRINFNISLLNSTKPFNIGLRQYMRKAACPSGGMDSFNPCYWRGKRLHHHGGDVCCVFVFCVTVSLGVCKQVPEHILKVPIWPYYKFNRCYSLAHPSVPMPRALRRERRQSLWRISALAKDAAGSKVMGVEEDGEKNKCVQGMTRLKNAFNT